MRALGISAFYHDSAAALVEDGRVIAAAQEERFTRIRHDAAFPSRAVSYCLSQLKGEPGSLDCVVFYEKPFLKFERLLETYLAFAPHGIGSFAVSMPLWIKQKLFQKRLLCRYLRDLDGGVDWESKLLFTEHHLSHAASAFFPSPFAEAAVLTMDGVGEWATTSMAVGSGNTLQIVKEIAFPHSLGLLYSAFTYYCGFKVNSGEYKLMGLAPYGQPKYARTILEHLIDLKEDGSFRLNIGYFDYCTGLRMTNRRFDRLFGGCARQPAESLEQRHMDLAASIQAVLDEAVLRMTRALARETGARNLCMAGGVALNCVTNGKILRDGKFSGFWIQPAAGDAGGAVGAALAACHLHRGLPRGATGEDTMSGAYLGPSYTQPEIEQRLRAVGARFRVLEERALLEASVDLLVGQKVVGWFQGRMEFGPRALGARSILGDPRSASMQSHLNLMIKRRESFRPFAPSVLAEEATQWFDLDQASPYMLLTANVREAKRLPVDENGEQAIGLEKLKLQRSLIPATTHVDYSARVQTVERTTNPRYHALLTAFRQRTGCPVLVNTSFNVRGEPIVCTPEEAWRCFRHTGMDALAIGDCLLVKEDQERDMADASSYTFGPD
ncbi:MAG: carbamoyltransferase [Candidatus Solibacter sp.]|jgi:carbamoyltransferase